MFLDIVLVAWIFWGLVLLYRRKNVQRPRTRVCQHRLTVANSCTHPEVEQVEIGDGILVPREVVAKICASCLQRLPAEYSSPRSVILTNENSVPASHYYVINLSYWTEDQERLATGKEVNGCHE